MKYKTKILFIMTTIIIFFSLPLRNVYASTGQIEIITNSYSLFKTPVYISSNNQFRVNDIPKTINDNIVKKITIEGFNTSGTSTGQRFLNESYIDGSNTLPTTFETIKEGRYKIQLYLTTTATNSVATLEFKVWNTGNTGSSPEPEPTDPPATTKDYTSELLAINEKLTLVKNAVDNMGYQISNSITKQTTEINTFLSTINTSINTLKNDINNKLNTTNSHLNDIKKELQTSKTININKFPDISNLLEENKAIIPQQKFEDNNKYFNQPNVISNESNMPDMPDVKKWDNVDDPIELSKDEENIIDDELIQDVFTQDSELSQDSFTKDNELSQDSFIKDNELSQDNFNNTHEYEQTNKFERQPEFEQTEQDYNLRWKSINGVFQ